MNALTFVAPLPNEPSKLGAAVVGRRRVCATRRPSTSDSRWHAEARRRGRRGHRRRARRDLAGPQPGVEVLGGRGADVGGVDARGSERRQRVVAAEARDLAGGDVLLGAQPRHSVGDALVDLLLRGGVRAAAGASSATAAHAATSTEGPSCGAPSVVPRRRTPRSAEGRPSERETGMSSRPDIRARDRPLELPSQAGPAQWNHSSIVTHTAARQPRSPHRVPRASWRSATLPREGRQRHFADRRA